MPVDNAVGTASTGVVAAAEQSSFADVGSIVVAVVSVVVVVAAAAMRMFADQVSRTLLLQTSRSLQVWSHCSCLPYSLCTFEPYHKRRRQFLPQSVVHVPMPSSFDLDFQLPPMARRPCHLFDKDKHWVTQISGEESLYVLLLRDSVVVAVEMVEL